jgi:hypothetical protein
MKRVLLSTVLIAALSLTSFAGKFLAGGVSNSAFGNYRIEMSDNLIPFNGKMHLPYLITYENTGMKVMVVIDMDRKGTTYYVLSDDLSVKYTTKKHLIGVEFLDKEMERYGFKTCGENLDRNSYFRQKVIGKSSRNILENTKLIACFYPLLLNSPEEITAER